jgi:hypothetical protein
MLEVLKRSPDWYAVPVEPRAPPDWHSQKGNGKAGTWSHAAAAMKRTPESSSRELAVKVSNGVWEVLHGTLSSASNIKK